MDRCPVEDDYGHFLTVSQGTFWGPNSDDGLALGGIPAVPSHRDDTHLLITSPE